MPSLLSLVFAPSANAQTSWKPQAIPSQQVFSNVEVSKSPSFIGSDTNSLPQFLAHQNPFRLKALNSKEFLLTFEEPQALCAIPDLSTDQTDRSSVAARVVGAVPPTIWLARPDQQLIRYTPPIALESPARASNNSLVLARQKTTHSGDLKLLKLSQSSIECLNRNWIRLYLQQQHLAVRDVFRRTCFRKKDVPARAYTSSTRYFSEDHDGFYGVDVDTRDSSTTIADAYSAPVSDEEGKLAPTIALTQMDTVVEVLQATTANKVEPPKAVEEPNDSYVFVFPDEEEELEMLIREEAPKDLERMAEQARKASLVSTDQRSEAQVNDEAHLTPPEEVVRHRLDEEEDSEADTDVKADPATPEVATHYRLSDEMHDLGKESEEAAHEVQNEELHQDVVVVAVIQPSSSEIPRPRSPRPTSIDLPPHTFLVHNYERETIRGLEDHLLRSQNAPPHVIAELENPPRRPYVVPDGTELDPYWAPYENGSLIPESTTTSPEVCLWSANYSGDVDFYASCVREWWDNTQGAKLHDNMRRHALCINAWSHVYAVDSTVDYRAPYGAMNQPLAEAEYDPSMSGVKRKWWYKPGAKGFKALGNPETMTQQYLPNGARKLVHAETATNRRAFYPQRSRLREAQNASDDADEDSYVSTSDFDQTPAEEFQHLYAGFSQDMLDGGNASDRSESGIEEGQDEDDEEELPEEEIEGGSTSHSKRTT
ncbi:hypothetical protein H2199_003556 [Coniosporium tulheliwenetii]|uniref:Uncharacterized protein n=1 Tax=Coniosporium tulheliwenetii TaxID=3383036 RepID=A0ACC2ZA03_9PEZI|nr:hypothetical protein H2199_003556 [Cladosporium sp. JES 115]